MSETKPLVLLVEPDPEIRRQLMSVLEQDGYTVETSANASEALDRISAHVPEAVVGEWSLPDGSGLDLVERVKRQAPRTRTILMRPGADWPDFVELLHRGGDDLLARPPKKEELLRVLSRLMPRRGKDPLDRR